MRESTSESPEVPEPGAYPSLLRPGPATTSSRASLLPCSFDSTEVRADPLNLLRNQEGGEGGAASPLLNPAAPHTRLSPSISHPMTPDPSSISLRAPGGCNCPASLPNFQTGSRTPGELVLEAESIRSAKDPGAGLGPGVHSLYRDPLVSGAVTFSPCQGAGVPRGFWMTPVPGEGLQLPGTHSAQRVSETAPRLPLALCLLPPPPKKSGDRMWERVCGSVSLCPSEAWVPICVTLLDSLWSPQLPP